MIYHAFLFHRCHASLPSKRRIQDLKQLIVVRDSFASGLSTMDSRYMAS